MEKRIWAVFGTTAFIILGVLAFVAGTVLNEGWDAVLGWFTSRYAWIIYVALVGYAFFLVWFFVKGRKHGRG